MIYVLVGLIALFILFRFSRKNELNEDMDSMDVDEDNFVVTVDTDPAPPPVLNDSKANFEVNGNSYYLHVIDILLLYWVDGKQLDSLKFPQYFQYYGINPLNELNILLENNLVVLADDRKSLVQLKVVDLKEILRNNDQKVSGKKQELIDRIVDNLPSYAYKPFISDTYTLSDDGYKLVDKFDLVIHYHKNIYSQIEPVELLPYLYSPKSNQEIFIELNEKKMWYHIQIGYIPMASSNARSVSHGHYENGDYSQALIYGIIAFLFATSGLSNSDREYRHFIVPFQAQYMRIDPIINAQLKINCTNLEVLNIAREVFNTMDKLLPKPYIYSDENDFTELLNHYLNSDYDKAHELAKSLYYKIPKENRSSEFERYS